MTTFNEIPLGELDALKENCLHELEGFLGYWKSNLSDPFPETMLPGDIRNLMGEVLENESEEPEPSFVVRNGKKYYRRQEFLSWFRESVLRRYE